MRSIARIVVLALALVLLGLAFTPKASPAQTPDPCDPARPIPFGWHLRPLHPCAGDSVTLVFSACGPCVDLLSYTRPDSGPPILDVRLQDPCPAITLCMPDSLEVPLGALAAGRYWFALEVRAGVVYGDTGFCYVTRPDTVAFAVGCPEPPPPGLLPFVTAIRIGPPPPCTPCPPLICPGVPIPFHVEGVFPATCYELLGIELQTSPIVGPRPEPPIVRLLVAQRREACVQVPTPFAGDAVLPALLRGSYNLMLELAMLDPSDSTRVDTVFRATQAFVVQDSCLVVPPGPCLFVDWDHSGSVGGCDAFVAPDRPASAVMIVRTPRPLAGLQGTLHLSPPGLRISALEAVGSAQGMHLTWTPTADGARFVMFADRGAPIGPPDSTARCMQPLPCPTSVLRVTVLPVPGATPADVTYLTAEALLGADSLGVGVPQCQIETLVLVAARICSGHSCDFNGDGAMDVRDLVTMVHCILGTGACPDTSLAGLDCDGNGVLGVDDVLCCAHTILRGGTRDTTGGRSEPGVGVSLGEPAWGSAGLEVPVRLGGADRVGAARLALSLPLDRYVVTGVETDAGTGRWLELHDTVGGQLVVGLVGLGPPAPGDPTTLGLTLHLALKPGQNAGGEIGVADAQFSGPDGVTLVVPLPPASVGLPGAGALELSAAQPNPFGHETRFSLNLERGSDVEVTIHDLSGRRVATLFHGALGAGPHVFAWQGRRSDGAAAPNGVYFLHARVNGERLTRKVVFLPGN